MSKKLSQYTQQQKLQEIWRRGVLHWLLHPTQKEMYDAIHASNAKKFVINCSRRLGKTYLLAVLALEQAIQKPGSDIKIATMSQKATRKILTPIMRQLLETCPRELRPRFRVHDGTWEFLNGSTIHASGTDLGQIDNLRGQSCDLALIDEAAFVNDLTYVCESVLFPQMLTKPHSKMILASTPPVSPDHPFVSKYMIQAMSTGAYLKRTIYDNPLLTPEIIEEFKIEAGGEDSTTWMREYLAEVVTDTDMALFPEVASGGLLDEMITEVTRPPFYIPITVIDLGYVDFTGVLFGYYHFPAAKIVLEDELLLNKTTSANIIEQVLAKERELWGGNAPRTRIVDGPALAIADMNETHRFTCHPPAKADLPANVNRVRMDLANKQFAIHPRCNNTISQIRYATWDSTRTKFSRSSNGGHWDLVAALVYLDKHIDRTTNPFPAGYGWDEYNDFGFARTRKKQAHQALKKLFPFIRKQ